MKKIVCKTIGLCKEYNKATQSVETVEKLVRIIIPWSAENEERAKKIAYNGEITIEEEPDVPMAPTQLDIIEAQVTYTAMMTDTLLEV